MAQYRIIFYHILLYIDFLEPQPRTDAKNGVCNQTEIDVYNQQHPNTTFELNLIFRDF